MKSMELVLYGIKKFLDIISVRFAVLTKREYFYLFYILYNMDKSIGKSELFSPIGEVLVTDKIKINFRF